jgi:hypothetical protein
MDVGSFVPLSTQPFLGPDGRPIANGTLFVMEAGSNNRAVVFEDAAGTRTFRLWPYRLGSDGRASLWVPAGHRYDIRVFGSTGLLLLLDAAGITGGYAQATGSNVQVVGNKELTYVGGLLTQLDTYSDATRTTLTGRKTLDYTDGVLTGVTVFDGSLAVVLVRTMSYENGMLVGINDVKP